MKSFSWFMAGAIVTAGWIGAMIYLCGQDWLVEFFR